MMKNTLFLAALMTLALAGTVFADEEAPSIDDATTMETEVVEAEEQEAEAEDQDTEAEAAGSELIIEVGEKSIYGVIYTPETSNGTLIIMSHGYNGTHNDWTQEGAAFSASGYTAYAYDFCGGSVNSQSSGESTSMTISSEKQDLLDVLDYFKETGSYDKIFLLGGSQGGFISSLVAAERKDEIGALAMYFPALCIPDNWKENYPDPSEAPDTFDFWGMDLSREFVEDAQKQEVYEVIGEYKGDVLILHGDQDPVVPYEYSERAADTYESCELVKMDGEGHGWSEEAWPKAIELVLNFFENH